MSMMDRLSSAVHRARVLADVGRGDGILRQTYDAVGIEIMSICNLSCPLCPAAHDAPIVERKQSHMDPATFARIVELAAPVTRSFILSLYGESLLNKNFFTFLNLAMATGRRVSSRTNLNYAARLAERLAAYEDVDIICSIDGWDRESYAKYRVGGRYETVMANLKILAQGKGNVFPQLLSDGTDPAGIEAFRRLMIEEYGIPADRILINPLNPNFINAAIERKDGKCHFMYANIYFTSDGYIQPCCVHVLRDLFLVHIDELKTPDDLRNHPKLARARATLARDKNSYQSCHGCDGRNLWKETAGKGLRLLSGRAA